MPQEKKQTPSTLSIVEQGGFQYAIAEGDMIHVPHVDEEEGKEIGIDRVLLLRNGNTVKVGAPEVEGAKVRAKVVAHGKDKKVLVMKKLKRKDYKRKNGHRQSFSQLKITSISA